jgi:hypothetical protein
MTIRKVSPTEFHLFQDDKQVGKITLVDSLWGVDPPELATYPLVAECLEHLNK